MSVRLNHIDSMRGFAILCMVQVHTAALLPAPVSTTHFLALISAAIGGMAAPMFVTISGWGLHNGIKKRRDRGEEIVNWIIIRGFALIILQFIVGILLPERYNWNSPGILTLLGFCMIISPLISNFDGKLENWSGGYYKSVLFLSLTVIILRFFPSLTPGPDWDSMIYAKSIIHWFQLTLVSGTYPLLPWIAFFFIGSNLEGTIMNENQNLRLIKSGLLAFSTLLATLTIAITTDLNWAETMGDGVLTFFPANHWFVIVSATWSIFLWDIFRLEVNWLTKLNRLLAPSGRLSLTIYLLHFALLGQIIQYIPRLSLIEAFTITIIHMAMWLVFGIFHEKFNITLSIEHLIRVLVNKKSHN